MLRRKLFLVIRVNKPIRKLNFVFVDDCSRVLLVLFIIRVDEPVWKIHMSKIVLHLLLASWSMLTVLSRLWMRLRVSYVKLGLKSLFCKHFPDIEILLSCFKFF